MSKRENLSPGIEFPQANENFFFFFFLQHDAAKPHCTVQEQNQAVDVQWPSKAF